MDQSNDILQQAAQNDVQEVVLRYEPQPVPIVERYIAPAPLPGQKNASAAPRRRKKALRRFLFCMLALLLLSGGAAAWWFLSADSTEPPLDDYDSYHDGRFEYRGGKNDDDERGATTIRRYPNNDDVKLRYSETHGEVLSAGEIYQKVNPSTVTVITSVGSSAMIGTGVIFTSDGYILTNAHVIAGGSECYVVLASGMQYPAQLLGLDEEKDIAVIKIDETDLPAAEFGDSDALNVGDSVYAIGNPLGIELRGTLTDGIVSAIDRDVYVDGVTMTLIQTNAALNNGNSGGPLINQYGQVVGINTMKMGSSSTTSVEGLGFAIPISSSAYMINDLISCGQVRGEAVLGITVLTATAYLDSGESGLIVQEVSPNGPGEEAGIWAGDLILRADGEALTTTSDLIRIRRRHEAGETVTLLIDRDGERFTADVVLRALEE